MKFGIDVSAWQGKIDWAKLAIQGVLYSGIRATVGKNYSDPFFGANYDGAVANGIIPLPYYVVSFDQGADPQAENYLNTIGERKTWFDIADVELSGGTSLSQRGRVTHYTISGIAQETHAQQLIYTRASWWDANMPVRFIKNFNEFLLWAADYGWFNDGQIPTQPTDFPRVPDIWESVKQNDKAPSMIQYTDNGVLADMSAVESDTLDFNLMGDDLYAIARLRSGIPEPGDPIIPPPEPPPELPSKPVPITVSYPEGQASITIEKT